jgi:hypothetical protein
MCKRLTPTPRRATLGDGGHTHREPPGTWDHKGERTDVKIRVEHEQLHKDWRKAKDDALKEAKKVDKATASRTEKWMKDAFDKKLGDKFDAAQKAFATLEKAWGLAKDKLANPAVRDQLRESSRQTVIKLDFAEVLLGSYKQSVQSSEARKAVPAEALAILLKAVTSLEGRVQHLFGQIKAWQVEVHDFMEKISVAHGLNDFQDIVARFYPELHIQ